MFTVPGLGGMGAPHFPSPNQVRPGPSPRFVFYQSPCLWVLVLFLSSIFPVLRELFLQLSHSWPSQPPQKMSASLQPLLHVP